MGLGLGLSPFVAAGKGLSARDERPALGEFFVDFKVDQLIAKHLFSRVDGDHRALWHAQTTVNAFVRIDHQHVLAISKGVDWADFNAICVLAQDARFGDDMSHGWKW